MFFQSKDQSLNQVKRLMLNVKHLEIVLRYGHPSLYHSQVKILNFTQILHHTQNKNVFFS